MSKRPAFKRKPYPRTRQTIVDTMHISSRKHHVYGLVEFDVTEARRRIDAHAARTGETLSFTAFMTACYAHAIDQNRHMQAYKNWRGQLILFDDVDVALLIEVDMLGESFPMAHIIRGANHRSVEDITQEIRETQANPRASIGGRGRQAFLAVFVLLPAFLRRAALALMLRSPQMRKQQIGTVNLSAVGMFGEGSGWAISPQPYTLGLLLGGIGTKPAYINGEVQPREFLSVTLSFDHDIIDGAPAARFSHRFKEAVESAHGLDALET